MMQRVMVTPDEMQAWRDAIDAKNAAYRRLEEADFPEEGEGIIPLTPGKALETPKKGMKWRAGHV